MKKIVILLIATFALVACNEDAAPSEVNESTPLKNSKSSKEARNAEDSQQNEVQAVTLEEAKLISNHIYQNFSDIWLNAEGLYLLDEQAFTPSTHVDRIIERYKAFATGNFLTEDFKQYVEQSCYACDMLPFSQDLRFAESIELIESAENSFSLKAYLPVDAITPEANVVQHFVLEDGIWKIDGEEIEILQQGDGMTYREITPPEPSAQFEDIYTRGNEAITAFENLMYTLQDSSQAEISDRKFQAKEQLQSIVSEFEQMIIPFDPYYETNKQFWTVIYEESVHNIEQNTMGGSGQEIYMIETEAELLQHRIHTLYSLYMQYL